MLEINDITWHENEKPLRLIQITNIEKIIIIITIIFLSIFTIFTFYKNQWIYSIFFCFILIVLFLYLYDKMRDINEYLPNRIGINKQGLYWRYSSGKEKNMLWKDIKGIKIYPRTKVFKIEAQGLIINSDGKLLNEPQFSSNTAYIIKEYFDKNIRNIEETFQHNRKGSV